MIGRLDVVQRCSVAVASFRFGSEAELAPAPVRRIQPIHCFNGKLCLPAGAAAPAGWGKADELIKSAPIKQVAMASGDALKRVHDHPDVSPSRRGQT